MRSMLLTVSTVAGLLALSLFAASALGAFGTPPTPPQSPPRFLGEPPQPLVEAQARAMPTTPLELATAMLAARDRRDLAALARSCSTSIGRPDLDALDAARAERDFYDSSAAVWDQLRQALAAGTLQVATADEAPAGDPPIDGRGTLTVPFRTAALDALTLPIVRSNGQWFLAVAP